MLAYIIRRIAYLVPVLLVLTVVVFTFVEMLPGNIIDTLVGTEGNNDPEVRKILEKEYGLDQPVYVRYAKWLYRAVQLDFGKSLVTRRPVTVELLQGIPATVYLAVVGISLSMLIAVPLGHHRRRPAQHADRLHGAGDVADRHLDPRVLVRHPLRAVLLALSRLAALLRLRQPVRGFWGSLKFLILPAAAIGFRQAAYTTRLTRSSMLDEMNKEYVDTARSLGLSERKVIFKYTLRNAMIPTITISGLQLANLLGGTVVLESIFAWPGIGRAIFEAILQRDYPLIQAGVLVLGVIVVVMNLLVDLTYRLLNPRVKLG